MKTKPIKLKDGIKDMTIEEVYKQFENFIYKACQSWRNTYSIDDLVPREQLVEEVRIYGTTRAAAVEIGNKYGLAPSTIRTYFDTMNVRKEAKKRVKENINKTIINNNEKIDTPKKTLVPVLFRGSIGEYEIQDKEVSIKFSDSSCVTLMKDSILGLITELKELSEILA